MGSRLSRQSSLDGGDSRRRGGGGGGGRAGRRKRADSGGEREPSAPFPAAVMLLRSDRLRASAPSPYARRVAWIRDIQQLLRERKVEEAASVLRQLRKDLGLEGTSLNDILYKNAAFLNLVDPISHELLLSLARDMQCPKKVRGTRHCQEHRSAFWDMDMLKSSDKICRQLIYHLTPHAKWLRQSMSRRKAQAWLKTTLQKKLCSDSVDLSGIPLSTRDVRHVAYYLQTSGGAVISVDLSFTELLDEGLRIVLPVLSVLPKLTTLALNGNRLTVSIMKDLTEALKTPQNFNCLAWIDLGNNVDIFTMPQPLLVALRRRCSLKSSLPTIYEYTEGRPYCYRMESSIEELSLYEEDEEEDGDEDEMEDKLDMEQWSIVEQKSSGSLTLKYCER